MLVLLILGVILSLIPAGSAIISCFFKKERADFKAVCRGLLLRVVFAATTLRLLPVMTFPAVEVLFFWFAFAKIFREENRKDAVLGYAVGYSIPLFISSFSNLVLYDHIRVGNLELLAARGFDAASVAAISQTFAWNNWMILLAGGLISVLALVMMPEANRKLESKKWLLGLSLIAALSTACSFGSEILFPAFILCLLLLVFSFKTENVQKPVLRKPKSKAKKLVRTSNLIRS